MQQRPALPQRSLDAGSPRRPPRRPRHSSAALQLPRGLDGAWAGGRGARRSAKKDARRGVRWGALRARSGSVLGSRGGGSGAPAKNKRRGEEGSLVFPRHSPPPPRTPVPSFPPRLPEGCGRQDGVCRAGAAGADDHALSAPATTQHCWPPPPPPSAAALPGIPIIELLQPRFQRQATAHPGARGPAAWRRRRPRHPPTLTRHLPPSPPPPPLQHKNEAKVRLRWWCVCEGGVRLRCGGGPARATERASSVRALSLSRAGILRFSVASL